MFNKQELKDIFKQNIKKGIIKLVTEQGRKVTYIAKEIEISEGVIRKQVKEYGISRQR